MKQGGGDGQEFGSELGEGSGGGAAFALCLWGMLVALEVEPRASCVQGRALYH